MTISNLGAWAKPHHGVACLVVLAVACTPAKPSSSRDEAPREASREASAPPPPSRGESLDSGVHVAPIETPPEALPPRVPADVGPMGHGPTDDGRFSPVSVAADGGVPILYKTVLHPDPEHATAELFVVAMDTSHVRLHAVAGSVDPEAVVPAAKRAARPAIIPEDHQPRLLAAFNGGWKSEHGHYGMKVDGVTLAAPNDRSCTVVGYDDDAIAIAPWAPIASTEPRMRFFRQAPPCLVTGGALHPGLKVPLTRNWGADAEGNPIIRRSAIGVDADDHFLFVAVSNPMSARAIAEGMQHVGAHAVAELDVNWSFPKFLVYAENPKSGVLEASTLFPHFVFDKAEYIRRRSPRDFFYLERR